MAKGKLIVIEGIDGSGKSTQFDLLCNRLAEDRLDFRRLAFPRYSEPSSMLLRMYLAGEFGEDPSSVNAYAASSFFAVDRYASYKQDWGSYYEAGGLILTDRYTTSNAVHQGAKLTKEERGPFFDWLYNYEFELLCLPAPDLVVFLDIDAGSAARRLSLRQAQTGSGGDIHENDQAYLRDCAASAGQASAHFGWAAVSCLAGAAERDVYDIHSQIMSMLSLR
ncbi:MAG: thymidylate kinase [Oscillospiraceae bacterium]|nr:thymidylate kinase [Oscillospiraceae bacterium]